MSPEQRRVRDDYLERLSAALAGVTPDVAREVRQEIAAHIEDALAARQEPTVNALYEVLARLGPPEAYAADVALYQMVDLGYRRWSLRHMIGSARFWALSTAAGAVVVVIFGLLYLGAFALLGLGAQRAAADLFAGASPLGAPVLPGAPAAALLVAAAIALGAVTVLLRWFIGQYVRRARPAPGTAPEDDWVARTSRRILVLALGGLLVATAGALLSGALQVGVLGSGPEGQIYVTALRPHALGSPGAWVGVVGLGVFFLAPILGLIMTVVRERFSRGNA